MPFKNGRVQKQFVRSRQLQRPKTLRCYYKE